MLESPNFRLDGKVALLTGSGRGIGLAIARALASAGCAVAIQDIDLAVARAEAERVISEGGRAIALGGDVTDLAWPERWIEQTRRELKGLHILVNNAAIQSTVPWLEMPIDEMERQYRANVLAPIRLAQLAVPVFKEQNWGRILNVGSIQQKYGNGSMLPYASGKAALANLTTAWARDLGKYGITSNLIAPGWFNTYRNRDAFRTPEDLKEKGKFLPIPRVGEPTDAAGLALLLCSEAGGYITGQSIYVDGGMGIRW